MYKPKVRIFTKLHIYGVEMIAENLLKLRKELKLSQNEFALKLGIIPRAYVNYERGERKPPYEMLITLSNDFDVNLNWLINDKGKMFNKTVAQFNDSKAEIVLQVLEEKGLTDDKINQFFK